MVYESAGSLARRFWDAGRPRWFLVEYPAGFVATECGVSGYASPIGVQAPMHHCGQLRLVVMRSSADWHGLVSV